MLCLTLPWVWTAALLIPLCLKLRIRAKPVTPLAVMAGAFTVLICLCLHRYGPAIPVSAYIAIQPVLIGFISCVGIGILFFRDPDRRIPEEDGIVVSPADGTVLYVRSYERGGFPACIKKGRPIPLDTVALEQWIPSGIIIGIEMSLIDVHVNRSPVSGTLISQKHVSGSFLSLRHPDAAFMNERLISLIGLDCERIPRGLQRRERAAANESFPMDRRDTGLCSKEIQPGSLNLAVIQIASRRVRRIVPFVREGDRLAIGQRIGKIIFGSQVDVILPAGRVDLCIKPGQRTRAGQTILAKIRELP